MLGSTPPYSHIQMMNRKIAPTSPFTADAPAAITRIVENGIGVRITSTGLDPTAATGVGAPCCAPTSPAASASSTAAARTATPLHPTAEYESTLLKPAIVVSLAAHRDPVPVPPAETTSPRWCPRHLN